MPICARSIIRGDGLTTRRKTTDNVERKINREKKFGRSTWNPETTEGIVGQTNAIGARDEKGIEKTKRTGGQGREISNAMERTVQNPA
jgi:hypothetical protein